MVEAMGRFQVDRNIGEDIEEGQSRTSKQRPRRDLGRDSTRTYL